MFDFNLKIIPTDIFHGLVLFWRKSIELIHDSDNVFAVDRNTLAANNNEENYIITDNKETEMEVIWTYVVAMRSSVLWARNEIKCKMVSQNLLGLKKSHVMCNHFLIITMRKLLNINISVYHLIYILLCHEILIIIMLLLKEIY